MNSKLDKILNWLKKYFTLNVFISVVTIISAWFGYDQYKRNNSGKVVAAIHSNYVLTSQYKSFLLVTTGDSIKIPYPQICPFYLNNSDFPIENINVNYNISCPIPIKFAPVLELNDGFKFRASSFDSSMGFDSHLDFNKPILYPNESTPPPFKSIIIYPNELKDSLFNYFDITSHIVYNGKKSDKFYSRINIIKLQDFQTINDNEEPTEYFEHYYKWQSSSASFLKGKLSEATDLLLAYHTYIDSTRTKGYFVHLKNITATDVDSIIPIPLSPSFYQNHSYIFKEPIPEYKLISWCETILAGIILCFAILFLCISLKYMRERQQFFIFLSIAIIEFCMTFCFLKSLLFYFGIKSHTLSIAISIIGISSCIYPSYLVLRYSFNHSNKSIGDWLVIIYIISMIIGVNYLFVDELLLC